MNDVSEESMNHGARECKEEVTGEAEEKCRLQHLAAVCCHMGTVEFSENWRAAAK